MDRRYSSERYSKINASVYGDDSFGSDQSTSQHRQIQKPQQEQLTFQSFFASIFRRLQEIGRKKTHEKTNAKGYSDPLGHLNKEIACQTYSEYCFSKISKEFGEEFLFSFVKDFHIFNVSGDASYYKNAAISQEQFRIRRL